MPNRSPLSPTFRCSHVLAALVLASACAPADDGSPDDPIDDELADRAEIEVGGPAPGGFVAKGSHGESVEVDASGAATSREPEAATVSLVDDAEREARRGALTPTLTTAAPLDATEQTIVEMATRPAATPVRILVSVDAPVFDFEGLRGSAGSSRRALVESRKSDVAAAQAPVELALADLGAHVSGRRWLSTHLVVETVAGEVETIATLAGVTAVVEDATTESSAWYDGDDIRREMHVDELIDGGYDSLQGANDGGSRIRIAVIEADPGISDNWPDPDHVGWRSLPNSSWSRLVEIDACNAAGCTATTPTNGGNTHGSAVLWAAGGDITDGQDPNVTGHVARERRSGVAVESRLYYYNDGGTCSGVESALEDAVDEEVDIINMSLWIPAGQCNPDYDCMTDAVKAAHDAGVFVVASAGNNGYTGPCTVDYPALLPQVLAAGATQSNDNVDYNDQSLMDRWVGGTRFWSATGPVPISLAEFGDSNTAGVDLLAPGIYRRNFTDANNYNTGTWTGTSMAAPILAGVAANMRDMFDSIGWSAGADPRALMVNMLVLGDNWDWGIGEDRRTQISDTSGFGRAKVHFPTGASMDGPWGWGWRSEHLDSGETKSWTVGGSGAESFSVEEFKWAVTWFDDDLREASDVVIRLYDTCPSSGGTQLVASDLSYNLRKSVHLLSDEIGGRCLEMRATAYQTPPGGVTIFSADYWHGGDPDEH